MSMHVEDQPENIELTANIMHLFSQDEARTIRLKRLKKQPWRTFYSLFVAKAKRKQEAQYANILQKQHVAKLWNIFLDQYFAGKLASFQLKAKKQFSHQKIIWQYWGQGLAAAQQNDTVKLCFASVDRFKGDYHVIRLDEESVKEYLDLPDFVWDKKTNPQFKPAFFADLIRLALLDVYGGVWIDATILLTAPIDPIILQQDFFMFQRVDSAQHQEFWTAFNSDYFGWGNEHVVNILNSFIVGKKGNPLMHICLEIMLNYWKTQSNIPHYFFFQIMFNQLTHKYLNETNFLKLDDTVVHLLQIVQNEEMDQEKYNDIVNKTMIHKLNYIKDIKLNSFNAYIQSQYINVIE
ncbi:capsular polysaccharide synthesis protein [Acinetobacter piscicola]|uniref:capsular polysaccharide synthesis protein n=1 Tax=Acinetobacter piscicola TaxID=2006115 RepID=UPI001020E27A|nr:capsular polysaccharide synthesis protein [Acinetobacter piscicola]RYL25954.1 capsular biosynthesis protein [Acinetobacter piscicola]